MKKFLLIANLFACLSLRAADNKMALPENYREWVWLSSGLGMSYTPDAKDKENPAFDNVFVSPRLTANLRRPEPGPTTPF